MKDSNPQDPTEHSNLTSFVAFGIIIGSSVGTGLFIFTRNSIWLAILPGLGLVVGAILEANRR